jgi:hypothetical protein
MTTQANTPTPGAVRLASICARSTFVAVGAKIGASEAAVRHYVTGRRTPAPPVRVRIAETYAIPESCWTPSAGSSTNGTPAPTSSQVAPAPPSAPVGASTATVVAPAGAQARDGANASPPTAGAESAETVARDTVRRLRLELDRLDADPEATSRERASVSTALTSATRLLARLSGGLEITMSQILRSPHWQTILATLVSALRGNVEALEAVDRAFKALGGSEP